MKRLGYLHVMSSIFLVYGSGYIIAADTPSQKKPEEQSNVEVVKLNIYPAPIPRPALKYRLLPSYAEQTPGNAALLYYEIFQNIEYENGVRDGLTRDLKDEKESEKYWTTSDKLSEWQETPLDELPKDEIRKLLDSVNQWWMKYLELATHRMECDWGSPIQELDNPFEVMLVHAQMSRSLARILATKARLEMAEGKVDEAIKTLKMGFTLSQQLGKGKTPMVINYLVGLAIGGMMRSQLLDLTQVKGSPNMYWSLSVLPHPFLSFVEPLEKEEVAMEKLLPELREAKTGKHPPEQWQIIWEKVIERINIYMIKNSPNKSIKYDAKKLLIENYPKAKEYMISEGRTREEVESMAPAQVILLYSCEIWEERLDDYKTWTSIDYSQWPKSIRDNDTLKYREKEVFPLIETLASLSAVARAQWRMEREIESLRIIEAMRLYAYNHQNKLPKCLDDMKEVPIPRSNPLTGKPYSYRLEDDTAVLTADGHPSVNYEYRIKIAK